MLHLVDEDRPDPWVPTAGPRQLMVSMYYPARRGTSETGTPAPYLTTEEARLLLQAKAPGTDVPPEAISGARTWTYSDGWQMKPKPFLLIAAVAAIRHSATVHEVPAQ